MKNLLFGFLIGFIVFGIRHQNHTDKCDDNSIILVITTEDKSKLKTFFQQMEDILTNQNINSAEQFKEIYVKKGIEANMNLKGKYKGLTEFVENHLTNANQNGFDKTKMAFTFHQLALLMEE